MENFDLKTLVIEEIKKFKTYPENVQGVINYFMVFSSFKTIGNFRISSDDVTKTYKKNEDGSILVTFNTRKDVENNGNVTSLEATIASVKIEDGIICINIDYNGKYAQIVINDNIITGKLMYTNEDIDTITETRTVMFENEEAVNYSMSLEMNEKHVYEGTLTDIKSTFNGRSAFRFSSPDGLKSGSLFKGDLVGANYSSHVGVFTNNIFVRLSNELAARYEKKQRKNTK